MWSECRLQREVRRNREGAGKCETRHPRTSWQRWSDSFACFAERAGPPQRAARPTTTLARVRCHRAAAVVRACSRGMRLGGAVSEEIFTEGFCGESGVCACNKKPGATARIKHSPAGTAYVLDGVRRRIQLKRQGSETSRDLRQLHRIQRGTATFFARRWR